MNAKLFIPIILLNFLMIQPGYNQTTTSSHEELESIRKAKDQFLADPENAILNSDQIKNFDGLSYFPVDPDYFIQGQFVADESNTEISLNTTSGNEIDLIQAGTVNFEYEGKSYSLAVYQNNKLPEFGENHRQLFIPFSDLTSGKETNAGGRYLPVDIPVVDEIMNLDFNKAMNPYSAYNDNNPGIIPPVENRLEFLIMAGERKFEDR